MFCCRACNRKRRDAHSYVFGNDVEDLIANNKAHPLDDGTAVMLEHSFSEQERQLVDGRQFIIGHNHGNLPGTGFTTS